MKVHTTGVLLGLAVAVGLWTGCASTTAPQRVDKSLYLNKRMMKFVVDNGPAYREVKLRDGSVLHYWRSDIFNVVGPILGRDDNLDTCELALKTDRNSIVREIYVIEDSIHCAGVLK